MCDPTVLYYYIIAIEKRKKRRRKMRTSLTLRILMKQMVNDDLTIII